MSRKEFFKSSGLQSEWIFQTAFNGETQEESYMNLRNFLFLHGFGDIPLPPSARRLWWDYIKPNDNGDYGEFVWYPIRITQHVYQENGLHLIIYNEDFPNHMALWEGRTIEGVD